MARLLIVAALLLAVCVAPAGAYSYIVNYNGSGSLMMSPVIYSGTFTWGIDGDWEWEIDDSAWPSDADSTARFNYIWDNHFAPNYFYDPDPQKCKWTGGFTGVFRYDVVDPEVGHIEGSIDIVIQIKDRDGDGVLSQSEKHHINSLSANFLLDPDLGTGDYLDHCGNGSLGTNYFKFVNPDLLNGIQGGGQYSTSQCQSPVETSSWGVVKALYR